MTTQFLLSILNENGAFAPRHTGRTLGEHLLNTYKLMKKYKCPDHVCLAGGLHSIYGTNSFKNVIVNEREKIKSLVGEETEKLIYLFSIINRPTGLDTGELYNYQTFEKIDIDPLTLYNLRLIEIFNLIEQGSEINFYPNLLEIYTLLTGEKNASNRRK